MDLTNKRILVIGLARSGKAAIKLINRLNGKAFLSENKQLDEKDLSFINDNNVILVDQKKEIFEKDFDLIIKNPGVPPYGELMTRLKEKNIPIITEIELAYLASNKQHYFAITGSNGKSTSTALIYEMFKKCFKDKALIGGNYGTPLCDLVLENNLLENDNYYISLEISNHQLLDIDKFKPEVSTNINLSPDHLETMLTIENYYYSKSLVYKNQDNNDYFLLNIDDEEVIKLLDKYPIHSNIKTFSLNKKADIYYEDGNIYLFDELLINNKDIKLKGLHNIQNILVSALGVYLMGGNKDDIALAIREFNGIEHRIEFVREIDGVSYYNDSKATNVDATLTALKAFDENIILLLGGFDKGLDISPIKEYKDRIKAIICFGAAKERFKNDLNLDNTYLVNNMNEAINKAKEISNKGDNVLLSPSTSSFDQYKNFEERGKDFKCLVDKL